MLSMKKFYSFLRKMKYNSWAWSYYVIIVLAILTNLIGYSVTTDVMEKTLGKGGWQSTVYMRDVYDGTFSEIQSNVFNIMQSNALQKLLVGNNMSDAQLKEISAEFLRDIRYAIFGNTIVEQCTVVLRDMNLGVTNSTAGELDWIYHAYFRHFYTSQQEWLDDIFDVQFQEFRTLGAGTAETAIYMFYTLPAIKDRCVAVIKFSPDKINSLLGNEDAQSGADVFISDKEGNVLFSNTSNIGAGAVIDLLDSDGSTIRNVRGVEYVVSQAFSKSTSLVYARSVLLKTYLRDIKVVRGSFIIGFLLCLIFGSSLARWFASIFKRRIEKQTAYMRTNTLEMLLSGRVVVSSPDAPVLRDCGINLDCKCFVAFNVMTDDDEDFADGFVGDYSIGNAISEGFLEMFENTRVYLCKIGGEYAGVLCFIDSYPDKESFIPRISDLFDSLAVRTNYRIVCTISAFTDDISQLSVAYEQVSEIMSFRFIESGKCIYTYDDIFTDEELVLYTAETENNFINAISTGNNDVAQEIIHKVLYYSGKSGQINLGLLRILSVEIVNSMVKTKTLIRVNETWWGEYQKLHSLSMKINSIRRFKEVKKQILEFTEKLCQANASAEEDTKTQKYKYLADYIEKNYKNSMLNINMIAGEFQMDRSWLSKKFREAFGIGILEYIVELRLKNAKELLKTSMNITQIAQETGFPSSTVFRYTFKKYEGVTPGQYRQVSKE